MFFVNTIIGMFYYFMMGCNLCFLKSQTYSKLDKKLDDFSKNLCNKINEYLKYNCLNFHTFCKSIEKKTKCN